MLETAPDTKSIALKYLVASIGGDLAANLATRPEAEQDSTIKEALKDDAAVQLYDAFRGQSDAPIVALGKVLLAQGMAKQE